MKKLMISAALGAMLIAGGAAIAQPGADGPGAGHGPRGGFGGGRAAMLVKLADTNGDGVVTKAELTAALEQHFAKMDLNKDGKITAEERQALRQQRVDARFGQIDTDRNGQISKSEFESAATARRDPGDAKKDGEGPGHRWGKRGGGFGGGWGKGPDADKDGTLTKAEFMARPLAMFDRADTNHDGKLTADEIQAALPRPGGRGHGRGPGGPGSDAAPPPPSQQ